jgi:hypothetical protein
MTYSQFLEKCNNELKSNALSKVQNNWQELEFVKEQDRKLCLEAVRQNGLALKYVDKSIFDPE